jgi:hypothetical protein
MPSDTPLIAKARDEVRSIVRHHPATYARCRGSFEVNAAIEELMMLAWMRGGTTAAMNAASIGRGDL